MKIFVSLSTLLLSTISLQSIASSSGWVHPGVLVTESQLEYVKSEIQAGNPVYVNLLNKAKGSNYGKKTYTPFGPPTTGIIQCGSYSNPDIGCRNANSDSAAAYLQAVLWVLTDDVDYANKSIQILNAYKNLKGYAGFTPNVPCPSDISHVAMALCKPHGMPQNGQELLKLSVMQKVVVQVGKLKTVCNLLIC